MHQPEPRNLVPAFAAFRLVHGALYIVDMVSRRGPRLCRIAVDDRLSDRLMLREQVVAGAGQGVNQRAVDEDVVGEQPILAPGEAFEYTSGTPLATPSGMMSTRSGLSASTAPSSWLTSTTEPE